MMEVHGSASTIHLAQLRYFTQHGKFAGTLTDLGPAGAAMNILSRNLPVPLIPPAHYAFKPCAGPEPCD